MDSDVCTQISLAEFDDRTGHVYAPRDERGRFRAIEVVCSYSSIDAARNALQAMMREIARSGATMFPQDCLQ